MADPKENKKERSSSITKVQKKLISDFMDNHRELVSCQFSATFSHQSAKLLWCELLSIIISVPGGGKKDNWQQVRKCWQDMKKTVKKKQSEINKYCSRTGGGGPPTTTLDGVEETILTLVPTATISGDPNILESAVFFSFDNTANKLPTDGGVGEEDNLTNSMLVDDVVLDTDIGQSTPSRNTTTMPDAKSCARPEPKKKLSKTVRLSKTLNISENMLAKCSEKIRIKEAYYKKKLELLEADSKRRGAYEAEKLELLRRNGVLLEQILQRLPNVCPPH
ncbi:unnamed protein product [Brassicogethes aeneus]|uniref:Regulatory protein zeste n=1 Tax=Brassicogethes aeneus TaxID=1431903 RepID=A0A9P0FFZ2_BRAAE|nr:unnamed protein product [Brassicogethes aeneus]